MYLLLGKVLIYLKKRKEKLKGPIEGFIGRATFVGSLKENNTP